MLRDIILILFQYMVVVNSLNLKNHLGRGKVYENLFKFDCNGCSIDYDVCETEECVNLAILIQNGMNKSADPCDDFYTYVCGSWPTNYPVPEDKFKWDLDGMVEQKVQSVLKTIVRKQPEPDDSVPLNLEKKWFNACLDKDRIEETGLKPLVTIIEELGGWPMTMGSSAWSRKEVSWQRIAQYYASIVGGYSLFTIGIQPDAENSSVQILMIDQPSGSLIGKRLLDNKEKAFHYKRYYDVNYHDNTENSNKDEEDGLRYANLIKKVAYAYAESIGESPSNIKYDTIRMLQFEGSLKEIRTPVEEKVDMELGNDKMTIKELQRYYNRKRPGRTTGRIDWLEMIRALFMDTGIEIDASEEVAILDKPYIHKLIHLLKRTSQRTIVNYLHWSFVRDILKYLDTTTRQWFSETVNSDLGIKQEKERWEDCLENMPITDGVSYEFIKAYFPEMIKETATDMAEEIREEIDFEISRTNWMNSKTKSLARNKLKAMKVLIGYPEWYDDRTDFNALYNGLEVGPDYFENVMNHIKFVMKNTLKDFKEPFEREQWLMTPITSNAYYFPPSNSLTVTAAQLLTPIFSAEAPMALNYGSVGFIIGHEMSHGFDVTGRKYDKDGNAIPWWSEKMVKEYKKRADCFVDQFNNYEVDGKVTEGENIADTAGLNAAFGAYDRKVKKEQNKDLRLPGLEDLDGNKLFFVSFSTSFCQSATSQFLDIVNDDVHTKASIRVNGAIKNVVGFSEAFQCSEHNSENSDDKCILWN